MTRLTGGDEWGIVGFFFNEWDEKLRGVFMKRSIRLFTGMKRGTLEEATAEVRAARREAFKNVQPGSTKAQIALGRKSVASAALLQAMLVLAESKQDE